MSATATCTVPAITEIAAALSPGDRDRLLAAAGRCVQRGARADPDGFAELAKQSVSCLPGHLTAPLRRFGRRGSPGGGLLIRGLPLADVPQTPDSPLAAAGLALPAAGVLGIIAAVLGEMIGYSPELGGQVIQDIVPVRGLEATQQSASSTAELFSHVELAFADDAYRAGWILLLCLRADHDLEAGTVLSPLDAMLPLLYEGTVQVLRQPRFHTTVDQSWLRGLRREAPLPVGPIRVLSGDRRRPELRVDFAETTGDDRAAQAALDQLRAVAQETAAEIRLRAGDLLVVDNRHAVHGRTPFRPRYDGGDRWLLRASVVASLAPSAYCRPGGGRVVDPSQAGIFSSQEARR